MLKARVLVNGLLHSLLSNFVQILDKWKGLHLGAHTSEKIPEPTDGMWKDRGREQPR